MLPKGHDSHKHDSHKPPSGDSGGLAEETELLDSESASLSVSESSVSPRSNVETMVRRGEGCDGL